MVQGFTLAPPQPQMDVALAPSPHIHTQGPDSPFLVYQIPLSLHCGATGSTLPGPTAPSSQVGRPIQLPFQLFHVSI